MQSAPGQGQFMALLVELTGARRCLEIGTFTGYSALAVAQALPDDGRLVACDVNETTTAVARRYWREAGVAQKNYLRPAPARDTLAVLLAEGAAGSFAFVFTDADTANYAPTYHTALHLLRNAALTALQHLFWAGPVI